MKCVFLKTVQHKLLGKNRLVYLEVKLIIKTLNLFLLFSVKIIKSFCFKKYFKNHQVINFEDSITDNNYISSVF